VHYTVKTVNLDLDTVERLQKASASKGQSMSQIVRDALADYFDRTTVCV
jgi:predicted transcriptional regulator